MTRPAQAYCKRCANLFCYFREHHARRFYCTTCVKLEYDDQLQFNKVKRRKNAFKRARENRSIKPLSRFATWSTNA